MDTSLWQYLIQIFKSYKINTYSTFSFLTVQYIRVEWFSTFCDFRKATRFCWSGIYLEGQFQKISKFCCARPHRTHGKVFIFKKNQRGLNYTKEQSPIIKFKIKCCLIFFKNSQKWPKRFFDLKNSFKKCFPPFSLFFAFKQAKGQILFQV